MTIPQHNYLPEQYQTTNQLSINHNYLRQQFAELKKFDRNSSFGGRGDFTLGQAVDGLEAEFQAMTNAKYAIGVGSEPMPFF